MKPMKLIYITTTMPFGRGEEFLAPEAHELIRLGHEVLIAPRSPKGPVFSQDAVGLDSRSLRRSLLSPAVVLSGAAEFLRHPAAAARALRILIHSENASVFTRNLAVFPKALWLSRVARNWQADHIHAHWGLTTATIAMIASELTGIPWSLTLHRADIVQPNLLATKMEKAAFARYISNSGLAIARESGALRDPQKACVIHMGVTIPTYVPMQKRDDSDFIVLCPAHLYPVKGHEHLIRAMRILRDRKLSCLLWIAGEGYLLNKLQHQVKELDLSGAVSFLGPVPHERILGWYRVHQVDSVVLPSVDLGNHVHEGIPVALMEPMAYGIPVISTETGGIPELIGEGAGIMVPPADPGALADALEQLIRNPTLCSALGAAGRQKIEEQFSIERTVAELAARIQAASAA